METQKESNLINALKFIRTGKNLQNRIKILCLFALSFLRNRSPQRLRVYFDLPVRGMILETDVKFCIRTLFDFFVFSSVWEPQLKAFFQFKEGTNFLDVGAHIGKYTVRAGIKARKGGKVVAVEPNKSNFMLLKKNISLNRLENCIPINVAAYSEDMQITLFTGFDSAKNSIKEDSGEGSYRVKARALDGVLMEVGIEDVDLIKIDVEGAEYETLKGLEKTLIRTNPKLIVEVLKKDKDQVLKYMRSLGYKEKFLHLLTEYDVGLVYYLFEKQR